MCIITCNGYIIYWEARAFQFDLSSYFPRLVEKSDGVFACCHNAVSADGYR